VKQAAAKALAEAVTAALVEAVPGVTWLRVVRERRTMRSAAGRRPAAGWRDSGGMAG